jgi:hypothetical protein
MQMFYRHIVQLKRCLEKKENLNSSFLNIFKNNDVVKCLSGFVIETFKYVKLIYEFFKDVLLTPFLDGISLFCCLIHLKVIESETAFFEKQFLRNNFVNETRIYNLRASHSITSRLIDQCGVVGRLKLN